MGIPHLITYLQPYAEPKSLNAANLVIDGPGLAYHIHHLCLRLRPRARNPLDAAPSYKELGEATIVWLNELQERGAILHQIFFDGFLPLAKYPTRTKRLACYTKQLNDYYVLHTGGVPSSRVCPIEEIGSSSLFVDVSAHPGHSKISAPPFLVPAVLDALFQDKKYSDIVSVVPGEADLYCARYLQGSGGTVVTGDSDLLVHDLGPNGAVAFLKDIDFTDTLSTQFVQYQPTLIAQRLGLDVTYGLRALAFELVIDSHKTFRQLLQRAVDLASIKEHNYMYDTFITEYQPLDKASSSGSNKKDVAIALSRLDPRISEYIRQFEAFATTSVENAVIAGSATTPREDFDVFLPFLLDCPTRTSAWESSTHIRQLAYGLVNLVVPDSEQVAAIVEHRRQQTGSRGRSWQIPIGEQIQEASQSLLGTLQDLRSALHEASGSEFWRAAALYQDIAWAESNNKNALSDKLVFTNDKGRPSTLSWDSIHFCAQMHGTYYSYRILKQILGVIVSYSEKNTLPPSVVALHLALEDLPVLSALSSIREEADHSAKSYDLARISTIKELLLVEEPVSSNSMMNRTKLESKKKRKRSKSVSKSDAVARESTNPFDLLSDI